jgi:hypothetical protein
MKSCKPEPTPSSSALAFDKHGEPLPLRQQPAYVTKLAEIEQIDLVEQRVNRDLERDRARARAQRPVVMSTKGEPAKPKRSPLDLVKQLAAGGAIARTPPASGIAASERELQITTAAKIQLHAELREIAKDLSHEIDKLGAAGDHAALLKLYGGLAIASEALTKIHTRRAHSLGLGYQPYSGFVLPSGYTSAGQVPALAYLIGDGGNNQSALAKFRNWLTEVGIMK